MTKTISKRKKCKKAKWLSEEALQISEKRREVKSKGERERYTQLNSREYSRRDKKASLNEQCKEVEENNRMRKTRDLFKKTGDIRGTFHARTSMIKERSSKNLKETEEVKKRWQEYTEKLYKEVPNDPDNHNGVVTHLDIRQ